MFVRRVGTLQYPHSFLRYSSTLVKSSALSSQEAFESHISSNPILNRLWTASHTTINPDEDGINAISTLPIVLRSKDAVFFDVAKDYSGGSFGLKVKQFTAYFKSVIHFYRVGIQNVWRNRKVSNEIKNKYHIQSIGKRGAEIQRKVKNGQDLVQSLFALESLERFEQEALNKFDSTTLLNITRREFQTVLRTERDFFKIPVFAIILLIFAETTPVLCTLIPEIAPSTCVFPGLIKKIHKSSMKAQSQLNELRLLRYGDSYSQGIVPTQSVLKLPIDELRLVAKAMNLTSRYIPIGLYPSNVLQTRMTSKYKELKVDNYFLVYGKQTLWDLKKSELMRCCVDRGLIDFEKDDLSKIGSHELQSRLFFFIGMMENDKSPANVALFGVNHLGLDGFVELGNLDSKSGHNIHAWWVSKHKGDDTHEN